MHGFSNNKRLPHDLNLRQTSQRGVLFHVWEALKSVFGQGSAPDPTGVNWRSSRHCSRHAWGAS